MAVIFAYRGGGGPLRRIPAGLLFLGMIVLSICAFTSLPGLAVSALVIIAASVVARIPPWSLLNGAGPLVALAICVTLFKTFQPGAGLTTPELVIGNRYIPDLYIPNVSAAGFVEGIIAGVRLLVSFAAAALLFATITMRELRRSLAVVETKAAAVIRRGPPAGRLSLAICLMLGFIPRFFEVWEDMNCACEARSCKRGPRRLAIIIPLAAERLMEAAADTALALEARGNSRL